MLSSHRPQVVIRTNEHAQVEGKNYMAAITEIIKMTE
jgi:hypothetical protein